MPAAPRPFCLVIALLAMQAGAQAQRDGPARGGFQLDPGASDPVGALPPVPAALESGFPASGPSLYLIQLTGPARAESLESLAALDIEVLQYVPRNAFAVLATAAEVEAARATGEVRWTGPYPAALKLPPGWIRLVSRDALLGPPKLLDAVIQVFEGSRLAETSTGSDAFRRFLTRAGARILSVTPVRNRVHIRALLPSTLLPGVVRWPAVFRVEPFPRYELFGERSAVIADGGIDPQATCVAPGHDAWLARKGVDGTGITIQVMDDGIEQGDASGLPGTAHPDLLGRIAGTDNATADAESESRAGHGSFNAGLISGTARTGIRNAAGFLPGQGVAPGTKVFSTKIFNNLGRFQVGSRSFRDLVSTASNAGSLISSNSWGADVFGGYDFTAAEFDSFARDVNDDAGEQLMCFIFAAGNAGETGEDGLGTLASPASAKNVISVGASEGCAREPTDGCGVTQSQSDAIQDVVAFSSRGPLSDGRLAPTLLAPGTQIEGIASSAAGYDGTGLCDRFWPVGQILYTRSSGTSHSSPIVAGAAALFHEWRSRSAGAPPSPALVKAALVASARDTRGGADGFGNTILPVPSNVQGWGLVSLEGLIPDAGSSLPAVYLDQEEVFSETGASWEKAVFPVGSGPMKIVLTWSDPPGMPDFVPVLVNDLDLEVESGGDLLLGNVFENGESVPGGERDSLNNLECVFLAFPAPVVKVRVTATVLPGDGVPGGGRTDQDFALVILGATDQSRRGVVTLRRPAYACGATAEVVLSDSDLKGAGTASVTVSSTAAAEPVMLVLSEVRPDEGVFGGQVRLAAGPGELRVADGSSIKAVYADADDGTGAAGESIATALVDCSPPSVSGLRVEDLTLSSARILWETSEETRGLARFGTDCAGELTERFSPRRSRSHEVSLEGLPPGTRHVFEIVVSDLVGNETISDRGGACFSFFTSHRVCVFDDDLEPLPLPGWTHSAEVGPDDWESITFPGATSPTHAWHANVIDGFKDSSLLTPPLDILPGDRFTFTHTFELELGFDGAVLEISTDGGAHFTDLGPFLTRGSYVDLVSGSALGDRLAWTGDRTQNMTPVEADLSSFAGPARRIRFRIVSDSSNVQGFGWFVDDITLCRPLNRRGSVDLDGAVFPCGARPAVRLSDFDLMGAGFADISISSTSKPEGMLLRLAEDSSSRGLYRGEIALGDGPGELPAADGDEVLVSYTDADNGFGEGPAATLARARVDCRAPVISGVRVLEMLDDEATIAWDTDEPSIGEVTGGPSCSSPDIRKEEALGGTAHAVVLDGLVPDTPIRYRVTVRDEAKNASVDDAGGACRVFNPRAICAYLQDFDGPSPGWTQMAAAGSAGWALADSPLARTPPGVWAFTGPESPSDVSLVSPPFRVSPGGYLSFWHSYEFETGFDGGVIEISADGGASWLDLGTEIRRGGYDGVLEEPNPIAGRRAWTGGTLAAMSRVVVGLSEWSGRTVQVRFRATSDSSIGSAGWIIDHFEVCLAVRDESQLSLDRAAYTCAGSLTIQVLDSGVAGLGAIDVRVTSTSEPGGETVRLTETAQGSGVFAGALGFGPQNAAGALRVLEGDTIRAAYMDERGRGGAPEEVAATALVDCSAPVIGDVRVVGALETSAELGWTTSEPASGLVEAGATCGAWTHSAPSGSQTVEHRALLTGLAPGSVFRFRVTSVDAAGNETTHDNGGACFELRTLVSFVAFEDDLQPSAERGWAPSGRWRLGPSNFARSPPNAWIIDGDGKRSDSSLLLPPLPVSETTTLELFHAFGLVEGREGGVLEASTDGGLTWMDLGADIIEGGYTGFLGRGTPLEGRRAWTDGMLEAPSRVLVSVGRLAGPLVLFRLRWASPGEDLRGTWVVDDIRLSTPTGGSGRIALSMPAFPCEGTGSVVLADADLSGAAQARVRLSSSSAPEPLEIVLAEESRGFFRGSFTLAAVPGAGALPVAHGDVIEARYADARAENGAPAEAITSADVDCVPPSIRNVRAGRGRLGAIEILWETDEPAGGRVLHGPGCDALPSSSPAEGFGRSHTATMEGIATGASRSLRVEAVDIAGNAASSPGAPACAEVTLQSECIFEDSFEPARSGWTHSAAVGVDDWRVVNFARSRSPPSSFHSTNTGDRKDASLVTPAIDIPEGAVLTFFHTFELESGFDGGVLEASADGIQWIDLGPRIYEGGYNDSLDGVAAWTGGTIGVMRAVRVALEDLAGPARRIRFRILCDDSVGTEGWFIDDVSVCVLGPGTAESRFTRGNCSPDGVINITDAVFLLNHLFLGGPEPGCFRACDVDADDAVSITDAIYLLNHLFLGGLPPQPPDGCEAIIVPGVQGCESDSCVGL